jgi:hypothetical protein
MNIHANLFSSWSRPVALAGLLGLTMVSVGVGAADAPTVPPEVALEVPVTGPGRGGAVAGRIEAWVVLSMPGAVAMPARNSTERRVNQIMIDSQQSSLMQDLAAAGAIERGRQTLTRSAVLVEVDEAALERIARLPGVARVQRVTHLHSTDGQSALPRRGAQPAQR